MAPSLETVPGIREPSVVMSPRIFIWSVLCLSVVWAKDPAATMPRQLPGLRPDGSVLLPNQWSLRPMGKQTAVGDFPVNA